jgi:hypothetical protein
MVTFDESLRADRFLGRHVIGDDRAQDLEATFISARHEQFTSNHQC